jgi:hypothetical protein
MFKMRGLKQKGHKSGFLKALIMALCLWIGPAIAQTAPPLPTPAASPCDPEYYSSLKSRAWMEAQREITSNQNMIYKPDSVLSYTCFDQFMAEVGRDAKTMFSENTRWGTILPAGSMTTALESLIGSALNSYILLNFNHSTRGGRSTGVTYSPARKLPYSCDIMMRVWLESKCQDFIASAEDGFFTFQQYAEDYFNGDHRFLPQRCGSIAGRWGTENAAALQDASTPWTEDNLVTFNGNLSPVNCGVGGPNAIQPVPTGLIVRRTTAPTNGPLVYYEKACIPPGCHYVPTGTGTAAAPSNTGECRRP